MNIESVRLFRRFGGGRYKQKKCSVCAVNQTLNLTIIALNPTSMLLSLSLLPYTGLLGTWLTLTVHHLFLNFPVFQSFHL